MRKPVAVALLATLAACSHSKTTSLGKLRDAPPAVTATVQLLGPNREFRGSVRLEQRTAGTHIAAAVEGVAPGSYAIHLHAVGRCDAPDFKSAGPHFNPGMKQHGRDNPMGAHLGDLPNVSVGADGKGALETEIAGLTLTGGAAPLLDADGAAVVLHAGADDYRTDPSGNSGDRIACGSIGPR